MARDPGKTEKATPRRRQKAREEGQVLKSQDFPIAATLISTFIVFIFYIPYAYRELSKLLTLTFRNPNPEFLRPLAAESLKLLIVISLPFFIPILAVGILSNVAQFGFLFSTKALKPKLETINPVRGMQKILSVKTAFELFRNIAKLSVASIVAFLVIRKLTSGTAIMSFIPFNHQVHIFIKYALILIATFGFLSIPIAVIDLLYRRWEYEENLKMSKEEVKEERKMYEGHPIVKSAIRRRQREIAMKRMMAEVPKADVVITNPEHYAVALKYERKTMVAPKVVAKGVDHVALRIKEIAKENDIPIVEDPPLAQALYSSCNVGDFIPEKFYVAIAKILARIYRKKLI